ncbi:inactive dipeptidyl peptidase 10-like isoform X2 [Argiope bruennichi]|uniref:inactive dipeptidyl peptidase 10-like isoform X2 n=1 Tax=Argiope bruennichi TaxID=94029 RepID=UPI002494EA31|nr:inactive dipeptidyl peptidase 10-like isoform X2 [Argiope bruennichi]
MSEDMTAERKHVKTSPTQLQAVKEEDEEEIADTHNWRGIGISLLVILGICSVIAMAILLLTPKNTGDGLKGEKIRLSDIVQDKFKPRLFNGSWISGDEIEYRDKDGNLVIYSVKTKSSKILLENVTFSDYDVEKYSVSADHNYVLLLHDVIKLYRYSFKAKYKIFDIVNKKIYPLQPQEDNDGYLQYAGWGPKDNQLVYVWGNNLFYVSEVNGTHHPVSTTGIDTVIFNGVPDWLYEEEILKSNNAIWWSPDGNFLCYATINDTKVGTFYYNWYGSAAFNESHVYPELFQLRYPKPGGDNPSAFLWVVDVHNPLNLLQRDVKPPREVQDQDHYFTSVQWIDNQSLAVIWLARSQNFSVVTQCTGELWYCVVVYEQSPPSRKGWVDLRGPIFFGQGGKNWYIRLPLPEGQHGHYQHVAMANNDTRHVDFLTQGRYDIHKVVAYHEASNTVYYLTTLENRPGERHLFSVSGKKARAATFTKCLTCEEGEGCLFFNVHFSPDAKYYILECLGPGVPKVEIRSIYNQTFDILDTNDDLRDLVEARTLPQIRTFQVPLKGGYKAQVRLFLPPGVAEDEVLMYPLVVFADGAPGSQLVTTEFQLHWGSYLSSRRNHIYAWIDGRGSGSQGDKMMHEVYYRLGSVEVEDQIEVTRYLKENLAFIHPTHIAIWGWFYGGYVAALALAQDKTIFKCAISVAPVTSWLYYDSAFTERYMGTPLPQDNYLGFEKASLVKKAHKFKGKKLLLMHGTADDKVHVQQSLIFMKALIEEGVLFQTQLYPDEDYSLSRVRRHLFRTMEDFLNECFYIQRKDEYENTRVKKDIKAR